MIGVCEALLYGHKAGLDLETVFKSVGGRRGGQHGACRTARAAHPRGNFEPGFFVEHFIKDMGIALAEAEKMNLALPGLALAKQLYEAGRARRRAEGHAGADAGARSAQRPRRKDA